MTHNTHNTHQITEPEAHLINRVRELRRITRREGYVMVLPPIHNTQNVDIAAIELSAILDRHNRGN